MNINLKQIATIRSPFSDLKNMPVQPVGAKDTYATIEFKDEFIDGLKDLDGFSHVYLIYYFHKIEMHSLSVIPFNDKTNTSRGVFSTRTPMHPNSIGLSVVKLIGVEKNIVTVQGIDILDGTPLLDIKPHIGDFDRIEGEIKNGWMKSSYQEVSEIRSDERFIV
ncbi:MAG: tRNA-Thr(GGU) m(6)t(6)A37 methyltransferase TsaA [Psychromonas sp.]|jgi:tRNA-Thr(GGU) m(6)t(6)A37 methyltransferase TsaA|uniref:tRNA (N6-threonylcarbamoyladenosine(37)-N6)-methyltransferase TrmO n=1 Tax=Psychromonas sp. TaxID=1884585 RepID=UPI0039E24875